MKKQEIISTLTFRLLKIDGMDARTLIMIRRLAKQLLELNPQVREGAFKAIVMSLYEHCIPQLTPQRRKINERSHKSSKSKRIASKLHEVK